MLYKLFNYFLHTHLKSLLAFLTVGALSAVINFSSFSFFWGLLKINYQISVSIAYVMSVLFHFTANRYFTFKSHRTDYMSQVPKYLVMVGINYLITLAVIHYVVAVLHLSPYIGIIAAIAMTVGTGYLMSKFWVFHIAGIAGGA